MSHAEKTSIDFEDMQSVERGIGPICARKWGLA